MSSVKLQPLTSLMQIYTGLHGIQKKNLIMVRLQVIIQKEASSASMDHHQNSDNVQRNLIMDAEDLLVIMGSIR
ncbi:hypothetical protein L1987_70359 [Smallanthus sonchifolius]|uniref:Uncharacterized protein n=1 Tax=Smallanthus sonchifolius TaxID=185202 RepID=A0ACB9AR01_9ASTR|nr:hypothetical protein L1987_70359 [Smallanthus sonchifolius]